jgi:mono/diheme cytochrome c family protein
MRGWIVGFCWLWIAASAMAAEVATPEASADGLELQLGEEDFRIYCATCHGIDGKGQGPVAEFMVLPPRDLTQLAKRAGGKFPADLMARVIDGRAEVKAHGSRDMPVWGDYFAAEKPEASGVVKEAEAQARIDALVAYLASIQAK